MLFRSPADDGLRCTVRARTFRGHHVAVLLEPESGPRLEAECTPGAAPEAGATVGAVFAAGDVALLPAP